MFSSHQMSMRCDWGVRMRTQGWKLTASTGRLAYYLCLTHNTLCVHHKYPDHPADPRGPTAPHEEVKRH